jgi:predicted transcriptional regulator
MMDAIFSIKPNFAAAILTGLKTAELRTVPPRKPIERAWIYTTAPKQQIVGYFTLGQIHTPAAHDALLQLLKPAEITGDLKSTEGDVEKLCGGKKWAIIEICNPVALESPIHPRGDLQLGYVWMAPQSYRYCGKHEAEELRRLAP